MEFQEYKVMVKVPAGSKMGSSSQKLPSGFLLGCSLFTQSQIGSADFFNAGIKDDTGASVNQVTDIRNWKQRHGGSFHQSYKPINEETQGKTYIFEVTSAGAEVPAAYDMYFQFVLFYKKNSTISCAK